MLCNVPKKKSMEKMRKEREKSCQAIRPGFGSLKRIVQDVNIGSSTSEVIATCIVFLRSPPLPFGLPREG